MEKTLRSGLEEIKISYMVFSRKKDRYRCPYSIPVLDAYILTNVHISQGKEPYRFYGLNVCIVVKSESEEIDLLDDEIALDGTVMVRLFGDGSVMSDVIIPSLGWG